MSRDTLRYLALAALLAAAGVAAWWVTHGGGRAEGQVYTVDVDNWRATPRQVQVLSPFDLRPETDLSALPFAIGDWTGIDVPLAAESLVYEILEPDQLVSRTYRKGNRSVTLGLVASDLSKSFHPPQICYESAGWQTRMGSEPVPLARGELQAMKLVASRGSATGPSDLAGTARSTTVAMLYFFVWPDASRQADSGLVMFQVTAPVQTSIEETLELEKDFIREFFTEARP